MTYLLDVNVLIALLDSEHIFHDDAHDWFGRAQMVGWATCPITENGAVRILSNPRYPVRYGDPGSVAAMLRALRDIPRHVFWPDDISLLSTPLLDLEGLARSGHVTDAYLLALAVSKGGKLATFDRRLSPAAVRGGAAAIELIG